VNLFGYNPRLEIWGTDGMLICNDPNMFDGTITLRRQGEMREFSLTPDPGTQMPYTTAIPRTAAAWAWPTWPMPFAPAGPTAPAPSWCSTPWTS
jgi:hypothetical protein